MANLAQRERRALVDELIRVGPDAPTLCEGWRASDLAAHLVIRERRPDAAVGLVLPPLAGHMERVRCAARDRGSWAQLVERVRTGPPFPLRLGVVDQPMNTAEYFIHHEDLRRAQPDSEPRALDADLEAALWARVRLMARGLRRSSPEPLELVAPGSGAVTAKEGAPAVTVTGPPGELLLVVSGRQASARVAWAGDPAAIDAVRTAKFGI